MSLGNSKKSIGGRNALFNSGPGIGGTAPVKTADPVASAPYYIAGQTITTTNGTFSGTPPLSYSYQWQASANGVSGWSNVGTNANTLLISTGSQQLLFYRCQVTASNAFGSATATSNIVGGVDSQANTHFNRVTADSGAMTYGLVGVDTYIKSIKFIYNITDITTKFTYLRQLDYLGYKVGLGTGVTAGKAVQTIYSACGVSGDLRQTSTTAQPALAAWTPSNNYYTSFGAASTDNLSTPDATANRLTTNFGIEAKIRLTSNGGNGMFICKNAGGPGNSSYSLLHWFGSYRLTLVQGGVFYNYDSTVGLPYSAGTLHFVRVSRNSTTGEIKFFTSLDGTTWTQLGATITGITGATTAAVGTNTTIGAGAGVNYSGEIHQTKLYQDDTFTTVTQFMNMNDYNRSVSQTTFVSSTGETYTNNVNTSPTGLKPMLVDQTMIQGNGTTMGMSASSLAINTQTFTQYSVWRKYSNSISAGSYGVLNEFGASIALGQGLAFIPNENVNTESLYTTANGGLNGTSWQSNYTVMKVSTYEGDVNGSPYEQGLRTNNVSNIFNAVQAAGANTTAIVATGDNLLARNNAASLWLNAIYTGSAMTISTDTNTEKSSMYNYLADLANII